MQAAQQQTAGERAALELQLQEAKRDLQDLVDERSELFRKADVCAALACDGDQNTVRRNTEATRHRLSAFLLGGEIETLTKRVRKLESQLKAEPAQVATVALSAAQCAAVDDTLHFVGVQA
jgi:polyhydroxyalkanoate synthesis regulator phasin